MPELTLAELVDIYHDRHAATVRPRTIETLRERLAHKRDPEEGKTCGCAICAFGHVPLPDLERMSGEIASWQAKLPERSRYGRVQALRQTLEAAVRWGCMGRERAKLAGRNRQPAPPTVRVYSRRAHRDRRRTVPRLSGASPVRRGTRLRPEEWQALEWRDVDRRARLVNVLRTVSDGKMVELGKTSGARRQVPLSLRALAALDELPARLDTPLVFPAPRGGPLNLDNWRRREWGPAIGRPAPRGQPGSTTCGRRSPQMHSPQGCLS